MLPKSRSKHFLDSLEGKREGLSPGRIDITASRPTLAPPRPAASPCAAPTRPARGVSGFWIRKVVIIIIVIISSSSSSKSIIVYRGLEALETKGTAPVASVSGDSNMMYCSMLWHTIQYYTILDYTRLYSTILYQIII